MKHMLMAVVVGLMMGTAVPVMAKPLKVFLLVGQSNMQGQVNVSTFDSMAENPTTAPILQEMRNADGTPKVCSNVWISSIGCAGNETNELKGMLTTGYGAGSNKIGPEFTFGIYMEKALNEPILIIKTAWGGKSLVEDFRPPSAGKRVFNDFTNEQWKKIFKLNVDEEAAKHNEHIGVYYRLMLGHVQKVLANIGRVVPGYDPRQGYELAGFVWFQGFNDMIDNWTYRNNDYTEYSQVLTLFIQDVRKDLNAPKLPFVIGVMGINGPTDTFTPDIQRHKVSHQNFRKAMAAPAALPEFKGNVAAVLTEIFWDAQLTELVSRGNKVTEKQNELQKDKSLSPEQVKAAVEQYRQELYTPQEKELLKGVSNQAYHYLGAARIIAPIGKAFAEAMLELQKK